MNLRNVIIAICSILFFMIGADKFLFFLEPPCSLADEIPSMLWRVLGVMQLVAGILIWSPKYRKYIVGFFMVFMVVFIVIHLLNNTYDIGGATSMAILLGLLFWNPNFIRGKGK